jgi:hypothetical protein
MNALLLHDPAGLLRRGPELAALASQCPPLRRAIERGRTFDAYRALFWASTLGSLRRGELAPTAKALLAQRRIFFKPLTGAPTMFTYNFCGTMLYGRSEYDLNDGTYIATLYVVLLLIPVLPIASYLVRDAAGGRRAWTFMAKVPGSAVTHLWQRAIALGVLALLGMGTASAFEGYGHNTLHVVNGLDRPVTADLGGGLRSVVPAGSEIAIRTAVGNRTLVITDGEQVLESSPVEIPRDRDVIVWNVLGAAPLYLEKVVYSATGDSTNGASPTPDVLCGDSFVVRRGVDYPFDDPPKSISTSQHGGTIERTHLGVARGGLETCVKYLTSHGEAARAAHLALTVARASRTPAAKIAPEVNGFTLMVPRAEAEAFVKDLLARDDSVYAHRIYQDWLLGTDQRARATAEYEARAAARPSDADAEYLLLRLRPDTGDFAAIDAAVARYPQHAFLRHMQVYAHRVARDFAGVVSAAEALHGVDAKLWSQDMEEHAEGLVAVGRGQEALSLMLATAGEAALVEGGGRARFVAFRVAHSIGAPQPTLPADTGSEPNIFPLFARVTTGIDVAPAEVDGIQDADWKSALRIALAARTSPDRALSLVEKATPEAVRSVPPTIRLLLLVEAVRRGEPRDALGRIAAGSLNDQMIDAIAAFVRDGTPADLLLSMPLEDQAALDFGRSRGPGVTPKEKRERVKRAREADVLKGPVTVAIDGWPS